MTCPFSRALSSVPSSPLTWATELGGARGGHRASQEASLGFCVLADSNFMNSRTRPGDGGASPPPDEAQRPPRPGSALQALPADGGGCPVVSGHRQGSRCQGLRPWLPPCPAAIPSLFQGRPCPPPATRATSDPRGCIEVHAVHSVIYTYTKPEGVGAGVRPETLALPTRAGRALCCRPAPALHTATGHCAVGPRGGTLNTNRQSGRSGAPSGRRARLTGGSMHARDRPASSGGHRRT